MVWPLKFRDAAGGILFADEAGGFFRSDESFLARYASSTLAVRDVAFLEENGHAFLEEGDLARTSFAWRWSQRRAVRDAIEYVILVPTLRCNLACSYCQVSRADERARGHDWTDETLQGVLRFLDGLETDSIKVEFQGGEPLLRVDLLEAVRSFCRDRFTKCEFIVCTNLQRLGADEWRFLDAPDTFVSTSIDGDRATHTKQRTLTSGRTDEFFDNLRGAVSRFGSRVSALPTIDVDDPPDPVSFIETFVEFGVRSIYLRPVNHQGFARKRHDALGRMARWNAYYGAFIDLLIERNAECGEPLEEFYFTQALRRVLRGGMNGHVDLRNPNPLGRDYIVVDFDGRFYPTDEARMMTRVGQVDLSVGNLAEGIDHQKLAQLNAHAFNDLDPDCVHCPYQAFCGVDLVDDISRSRRIDMPRALTDFCQRHTFVFDRVFDLIYSQDPKARRSLALWAGVPEFPAELAQTHA